MKTTSARTSSPTNVRKFKAPVDNRVDDGDKVGEVERNLSKGENLSKVNPFKTSFLIAKASVAFSRLWKTFIERSIFYHFHLEHHIWIETHASGFAIAGILNQLILGYMIYTKPDLLTLEIGQ